MFRVDGTGGVLAPAGTAIVNYRRVPWYASLSAMQTPAPNLYLGGAIMTDQVMARLALPLSRSELFFIGGYGGYTYARMANGIGDLQRNYDQFMGGLSLYGRMHKFPLTGAISYVAICAAGELLAHGGGSGPVDANGVRLRQQQLRLGTGDAAAVRRAALTG